MGVVQYSVLITGTFPHQFAYYIAAPKSRQF